MQIEIRQLRYFLTVAELLHFGRAALKLNMTQPPLSQAIQALEIQIGVSLFIRTTRSIRLTAAGLALIPEAQKIIQQAQALPELLQRVAHGKTGQISLAFISIADYSILPIYLRQFRQLHSAVHIELREATSDVQHDLLEKSEIDAGFLIPPIPARLQHQLSYQKILSEPLILALPENYRLPPDPSKDVIPDPSNLSLYQDLPLIIFPRKIAPTLYDTILSCLRMAGVTPEIGQEAIQMQTIIGLVSAGMGMALVPLSVSNLQRPGVRYQTLSGPGAQVVVEVGIAWRTEDCSPALHQFLALIKTQLTLP